MFGRYTLIVGLSLFVVVLSLGDTEELSVRRKWLLGNRGHFNFIAKRIFRSKRINKATAQYFQQQIDHFSNDNRTFKQRYWYSNKYYKTGGPAFLMIEGESEASPSWLEYETIPFLKMVKENNAMAFVLEHRFYGQSQPFDDLSTENLVYLSSRQALQDVATFIKSMNDKMKLTGAKWITFGGSYSGALSAWMREQYPDLVYGAVATSGPVLAQVNFPEYMEAVANAVTEHSSACANNLMQGLQKMKELMETKEGRTQLKSSFYLCESLEGASEKDKTTFYEAILGNYMSAAQYGGDNAGYYRSFINIPKLCTYHTKSGVEPIQQLANVNKYMMQFFGERCVSISYNLGVQALQEVDNYGPYASMRAWVWQTCTEFGYYQTTKSTVATNFFGDLVDLPYFTDQCAEVYGEKFTSAAISDAIDATNRLYGGLNYTSNRVVFPNGSWDPWHRLGILSSNLPKYTAVFMKGTAHCADMYEPASDDLATLKNGRETIELNVATWVHQ